MRLNRTRVYAVLALVVLASVAVLAVGAQLGARQAAIMTPSLAQTLVPGAGQPPAPSPLRELEGALLGASDGLYRVGERGELERLLKDVEIRKIVRAEQGWYFLSSRGVLFSADLLRFEERNAGIPVKVIKTYEGGVKAFANEIQEVKDLELDPYDHRNLAICTKDEVYLSRDGGLRWTAVPSPVATVGLKAVAITSRPEPLLFASHPINGPYVRPLPGGAVAGGTWQRVGGELGRGDPGNSNPDEIADIVVEARPEGPAVWASNSFLPRLYRYDFDKRGFSLAYGGREDFAAYESLMPRADGLYFVTDGEVRRLPAAGLPGPAAAGSAPPAAGAQPAGPRAVPASAEAQTKAVRLAASVLSSQLNALYFDDGSGAPASLSELWLVEFKDLKPYRAVADGRHGFYLQTGYVVRPESRARFDAVMDERKLDMLVIDLKDDYGRLRYEPKDPLVRSMGRWVAPLDVESFVREYKAKGRYLVARIVVFKDQHLHESSGGAYAVWDGKENKPWRGYRNVRIEAPTAGAAPAAPAAPGAAPPPAFEREYYGEYWVDPYSEKVWEYNVAIAREIVGLGFDEVQFDYIRFPTDGVNLGDAQFRWRDRGMDMESALMSFLSFARKNIKAPISIDIYGANGWYRSGVRTGQDVELLARYVDVIAPMFYPSHFEQSFMAYEPAVLRPYRIYKIGTLRNAYIARKKTVIRPYLQAFFLNVRYDREYYNPTYVALQVDGVRDATNEGLTFWNNIGRYDDIPAMRLDAAGRRLAGGSFSGIKVD